MQKVSEPIATSNNEAYRAYPLATSLFWMTSLITAWMVESFLIFKDSKLKTFLTSQVTKQRAREAEMGGVEKNLTSKSLRVRKKYP